MALQSKNGQVFCVPDDQTPSEFLTEATNTPPANQNEEATRLIVKEYPHLVISNASSDDAANGKYLYDETTDEWTHENGDYKVIRVGTKSFEVVNTATDPDTSIATACETGEDPWKLKYEERNKSTKMVVGQCIDPIAMQTWNPKTCSWATAPLGADGLRSILDPNGDGDGADAPAWFKNLFASCILDTIDPDNDGNDLDTPAWFKSIFAACLSTTIDPNGDGDLSDTPAWAITLFSSLLNEISKQGKLCFDDMPAIDGDTCELTQVVLGKDKDEKFKLLRYTEAGSLIANDNETRDPEIALQGISYATDDNGRAIMRQDFEVPCDGLYEICVNTNTVFDTSIPDVTGYIGYLLNGELQLNAAGNPIRLASFTNYQTNGEGCAKINLTEGTHAIQYVLFSTRDSDPAGIILNEFGGFTASIKKAL